MAATSRQITAVTINSSNPLPHPAYASFTSNLLLTLATNGVLAALALVTGPLVARLTGPTGRGELAAIQTWPSFLTMIAILGLPDALVYFAARDPSRAGRYLGSAIVIALMSTVPFGVLSYWLMPRLLHAQAPQIVHAARWYLLLLPIYAVIGLIPGLLRGKNDLFHWNLLRVMPALGWLALLFLAAGLHRTRPEWLAAGYLIVLASMVFPFTGIVRARAPGPFMPDPGTVRPLLNYGLPSMAGAVPNFLNLRLDQLIMAAWMAPISLGFYAAAVAWSNAVYPLLSAIGSVLFPAVAGGGCIADRISRLKQGVRLGILVGGAVSFLLFLATPMAFPLLFGAKFRPAVPTALVLVLAAPIAGINMILEEGLRGLGEPKSVLLGEGVGLLFTGVALPLLLRQFGIVGAALASVIGYSAITISLMLRVRRVTQSPLSQLRPQFEDVQVAWQRLHLAGQGLLCRAR